MHDLMPMPDAWTTWRERFEWHMSQIPNLIGETLRHRNPTRAARYDREIVDGGGPEGTPAPMNVEAVDEADALWSAFMMLGELVDSWFNVPAEDVPAASAGAFVDGSVFVSRMPVVLSARRGGVVVGVHALLDEHEALVQAQSVASWLVSMGGEIRRRPVLVEAAEQVEPLVRRLRGKYLVERRRASVVMRRRCGTCGVLAVAVEWVEVGERDAYGRAGVVKGVAVCSSCGQQYEEGVSEA